ncbi:NAD(P)-dependent oxidoreductase [Halalkalibacter nanhaiisediminis]|uniref:3-hydroxyisobutyrate dehydrogenase n=1 Tax=Halalkalibacter nanhaiisediminis TaxID=688079 RepID=A0A562QDA9_9BACI|nr:NAD(P)-dependent oxidoreductase [Halalkalibacter nanhaiisediminis]TWI54747.1 3-hydroxyisobutyrate dehydrogenase [Halalkalibacter nanhaiisediminis]
MDSIYKTRENSMFSGFILGINLASEIMKKEKVNIEGMRMMRVGIIGIGNMGGRIVRRFLEEGVEVGVFDLNKDALESVAALGAEVVKSPAQLALHYQYIITILPNVDIVKKTLLGGNGLLEGFQENSVLIEMTTSIPSVTKELSGIIEEKGFRMIDAPISGGVKKAEDGTLTIMVGGSKDVFAEAQPLLNHIGSNIVHVGEVGAGHTIKALNNLISATTLAVTGEAMALGVKLGLDPNKMLDVINCSTGKSFSSDFKFPTQVLTRKFEVGFTLDLMVKDLMIAMNMAEEQKTPMFISSAVYQLWKHAWTQGGSEMDHTAIVKFIEEMADVEIKA